VFLQVLLLRVLCNGTLCRPFLQVFRIVLACSTYSWQGKTINNQVATLNSVSLQYDGFGRRTKNLQNTSFLFDGANAVQELSGSTATGNLINGGIDEIFIRTDSTGSFTPLKDALGSTIALVDATGNLATQYSYDPFGNTTISGTNNVNEFQYTGRENEGNGLYYMRARYYSPVLHRFINPDPARFLADINFYRYCYDSPTNCADRFGLLGGGPEEDEEPSTPRPNTAPEDMPARLVLGNDVVDASERLDEMEEEAEAEARATDPLSKLSPAEQMAIARGACPTNPEIARAIELRELFYRAGKTNLGNFKLRPGEAGLSARDTLSNPWPLAPGQRPVFRLGDSYVEIDPAKLPIDSWEIEPDGHVSITAAPEVIQNAIIGKGALPK
jgi:RHS repeat-associated protein